MKRYLFVAVAVTVIAGGTRADDAGFYGNVDVLLLSAQLPTAAFEETFYREANPEAFIDGNIGDSLETGLRTTVGWEDCCGFGVRFRWFTFDNDYNYVGEWEVTPPPTVIQGGIGIDADAFDFEFTQRGEFRRWDLVGSAGLRYASLDINNNSIDFSVIGSAVFTGSGIGGDYHGIGPTIALSGERNLGNSGIYLFAAARTSMLFGESDIQSPFRLGRITVEDDFATVSEIQMGLNCNHRLWGSTDAVGGVFWEAQRWDTTIGDIGFVGLGLRAGLNF